MYSQAVLVEFGPQLAHFYAAVDIGDVWRRAQAGQPCYAASNQRFEDEQRRQRFQDRLGRPAAKARDYAAELRLLEVCTHEAGHAVVARLGFGLPVRSLSASPSGNGLMTYNSPHDLHDVVISMAGGIAVCKKFGREYRHGLDGNAFDDDDNRKILGSGYQWTFAGASAQREAASLVNRFWSPIVSLSHELFRNRRMNERELNDFFTRLN